MLVVLTIWEHMSTHSEKSVRRDRGLPSLFMPYAEKCLARVRGVMDSPNDFYENLTVPAVCKIRHRRNALHTVIAERKFNTPKAMEVKLITESAALRISTSDE